MRSVCCVLLVAQAESFRALVRAPTPVLSAAARRPPTMASVDTVEEEEELKVPMRVQLIVEPTPFTHVSGYANRFKEYLKYQKKAGAEVSIITPDDTPNAPTDFLGFPITTIRGFRFPLYKQIYLSWGIAPADGLRQGLLRRFRPWQRVTTRRKNKAECLSIVSEVVDDFEPELVHVTSPGFIPYMTTYIAREWKDVPLMISYHTHIPVYARTYAPWLGSLGQWISWTVIRQLHNCADLTVVTSPQMKEEFEEHGVQRVELWSKGIDTEIFHPKYGAKPWWTAKHPEADKGEAAELLEGAKAMRSRLTDGHPEAPLLIYVGRLGTEKRLRDLKDVLARIPEARLAVVGKGPDMEALQAHFADTKTVFTGLLSGVELSQAFAAADVFTMPSDSETLGFVVLESMASGVPVVGCNAGGIPSIIDQVARTLPVTCRHVSSRVVTCRPPTLHPHPHRTRQASSSSRATRSSWRATSRSSSTTSRSPRRWRPPRAPRWSGWAGRSARPSCARRPTCRRCATTGSGKRTCARCGRN